jgi:hypothetical protein
MLGSSMDFGASVPQEKSFAALLPGELSRRTGRKVEVYNESMVGGFPRSAALRMNGVLAAKPDLILWVLAPRDIRNASIVLLSDLDPTSKATAPAAVIMGSFWIRAWYRIKMSFTTNSFQDAVAAIWQHGLEVLRVSPSGVLFQHILYASQTQYVKSYLMSPESEENGPDVGFLKVEPNARWRSDLQWFDRDAAEIEGQANTAGVPLVAMLVPDRAQAAMLSMGEWPSGFDPYKLDDEVRHIISGHGGIYIEVLPDFRNIPNPVQYYFPIDGHPDARGHAIISEILAKELTRGVVPGLGVAAQQQATLEQKR